MLHPDPLRPAPSVPIPAAPEELTPAWLTAALRGSGVIHTASVSTVADEAISAGHGFTGQVLRLRLGYDAAELGAPASLIAKLPAADPVVRTALSDAGLYAHEVDFYEAFAADDLPVPRAYYAAADPATATSLVLLEDLQRSDGHVGDNLGGCTDAEAMLAVAHLARLQARWWNHPRLADLPWLAPADPDSFQELYARLWDQFLAKFSDYLPPRLRDLGTRAVEQVAAYQRWRASPPCTLAHNDFRLDNLFFGRSGSARPLVVFDWQLAVLGRGVADVAYFAAFCLPAGQRQNIERSLVETYHDGLLTHGVRGYDRDRCWQDYRRGTLGALMRLISAGALLDFSSERGAALSQEIIDRTDTILADHHVGELLANWGADATEAGSPREGEA